MSSYSSTTQLGTSVMRLLIIALIFSTTSYVLMQSMMSDKQHQQVVQSWLQNIKLKHCETSIDIPMIDCSKAELIKGNLKASKDAYNQQFARFLNLSLAVDKLQWTIGTEADAVKLLTLLNNITLSRSRQSTENYRAIPLISKLLQPVWREYPDMVAAASCLYCGNNFNVLSKLIANYDADLDQLKNLAVGHPRMLREVASQKLFEPDRLNEIVSLQAALSSAGNAGTAEFIGKILLQNNDYKNLRVWINNGLNGSRALGYSDLNALPYDLVVTAWQQGVSLGYDQVKLSHYLVSNGYRPALRWVLWLQASNLNYIRSWNYKREEKEYVSILEQYTDFPMSKGKALSQYYSDNWENIYWDETQKRWFSSP